MTSWRHSTGVRLLLVALVLAGWVLWLRGPSLRVTMWNVDETIHAAAARTLLDGGVMYRDAIDQRTPLSYYAFAAVFAVAGVNNLTAVRVVIALMIAASAFLLLLVGRRTHGVHTGLIAAGAFAAFSCHLLFPGDAYAANTEWFVALFTSLAAWAFFGAGNLPSFRRGAVVGALLAGAFLSKQPALMDTLPAGVTLLFGAAAGALSWRQALCGLAGIAVGFAAALVLVIGPLFALGAGHELVLYTWTYNLRYYAPEIGWQGRVLSIAPFFFSLAKTYPLALATLLVGGAALLVRVVQLRPTAEAATHRLADAYLLTWCVSSLLGAASSGRGFDHYFIQCFPPFALLCGWLPGWLWRRWGRAEKAAPRARRIAAAAVGLALAATLIRTPLAARRVAPPPEDPALRLSAFIRGHSASTDRIFVWGYNPDIYMYSNRRPASRFLYCSFQTGLVPWTNEDPSIDTRYAIVPGSMDALLNDLEHNHPVFIVDCGFGIHRRFHKYPLSKFSALSDYVEARYVEIEPEIFRGHGFRLFKRRAAPQAVPAEFVADDRHPMPTVTGPTLVGQGPAAYQVRIVAPSPQVSRIALVRDGQEEAAIELPPTDNLAYRVTLGFDPAKQESHRLRAIVGWTDGTFTAGPEFEVHVAKLDVSTEQQQKFTLPTAGPGVRAVGVRALATPEVVQHGAERRFGLHAPALLRYELPREAIAVRGYFGLPPEAYAASNPTPTDGAGFIVRLIQPNGTRTVLLDRLLQPGREPNDRPVQSFRVVLPPSPPGTVLEFEITAGPFASASSDWTFWSDLMLETSP